MYFYKYLLKKYFMNNIRLTEKEKFVMYYVPNVCSAEFVKFLNAQIC